MRYKKQPIRNTSQIYRKNQKQSLKKTRLFWKVKKQRNIIFIRNTSPHHNPKKRKNVGKGIAWLMELR